VQIKPRQRRLQLAALGSQRRQLLAQIKPRQRRLQLKKQHRQLQLAAVDGQHRQLLAQIKPRQRRLQLARLGSQRRQLLAQIKPRQRQSRRQLAVQSQHLRPQKQLPHSQQQSQVLLKVFEYLSMEVGGYLTLKAMMGRAIFIGSRKAATNQTGRSARQQLNALGKFAKLAATNLERSSCG